MKPSFLLIAVGTFLVSCTSAPVKMVSFSVDDAHFFTMCFSGEVEGLYALEIRTASGQEIKRSGLLNPAASTCFRERKMQNAAASYTTNQTSFYTDSLVTGNITSVKWTISRRYYEPPLAAGVFQY